MINIRSDNISKKKKNRKKSFEDVNQAAIVCSDR